MPQFPKVDHCIVCEDARVEIGNKISILGFFGIAPDVEISLHDVNLPVSGLLLFTCGGGEGEFEATANLLNDSKEVLSTSILRGSVDPKRNRLILGSYFKALMPRGGRLSIQVVHEGQIKYENYFMVASAGKPS